MTAVPMWYRDPAGKPTGFTVELMELAARKWESDRMAGYGLGKPYSFAPLGKSRYDRREHVDDPHQNEIDPFSDPYFLTGIVAIARKDSPLVSWKDLAAPSVKMGATMGSVHADFIEQTWGKKASLYDNLAEWMTDLKLGRIDSVMDDEMICIELANKNPELKILEGYVRPDTYGLAFRQDQDSIRWLTGSTGSSSGKS